MPYKQSFCNRYHGSTNIIFEHTITKSIHLTSRYTVVQQKNFKWRIDVLNIRDCNTKSQKIIKAQTNITTNDTSTKKIIVNTEIILRILQTVLLHLKIFNIHQFPNQVHNFRNYNTQYAQNPSILYHTMLTRNILITVNSMPISDTRSLLSNQPFDFNPLMSIFTNTKSDYK